MSKLKPLASVFGLLSVVLLASVAQADPVVEPPTLELGIVAQRYPWNGIVDVNYKTANWSAAAFGAVEIACGETVVTNSLNIFPTGKSKTGDTTHAVDLKALFGETVDQVKFKALVSDQPIGFAEVRQLKAGEFPAEKADVAFAFQAMDTVEGSVSPYGSWKADLHITSDKNIAAGTISFAGQAHLDTWTTVPAALIPDITAGQESAMIKDWVKAAFPTSDLPPSWHYCSKTIQSFKGGVKNLSADNTGTKLKVVLRLTSNEDSTRTLDLMTVETTLVAPTSAE